MWLAALILGLPLIEISLFVTIGGRIGLWATLGIILGTAVFGIWLIRMQGDRAQRNLKTALDARKNPTSALANDVLVVVAGALLVLPGFFTDACGLLLLLPFVRTGLTRYAARRARDGIGAHARSTAWTDGTPKAPRHNRAEDIIDATWEELPPNDARPPPGRTRH